jgi:hypothetical protein
MKNLHVGYAVQRLSNILKYVTKVKEENALVAILIFH